MLNRYREDTNFRHIFWLTVIYVLAHWFILVSTGKWYDDWIYADHNAEWVMEVFRRSSLPLAGIVNIIIWYIPYKLFVFVMFYAGGIFLYKILKDIDLFSEEDSFWVSALFLIIPINDARITYICFNYSLGLFCYLLSFYLITKWIKQNGKKRILIRIVSLLILILAFNAESVMLMVALMLLYLYYEELKVNWKWREIKTNIKKLVKAVIHYIDYMILPIANYVGMKILFPGYGDLYDKHSYIPWNNLGDIIKRSPKHAWITFQSIFGNWNENVGDIRSKFVIYTIVLGFIIISLMCNKRRKVIQYAINSIGKDLLMVGLGCIAFYLGVFPYIVKRDSDIDVIYTDGRDSLLLGIGTSIIIYYLLRIFVRRELYKTVLVFLIMSGILYFNNVYLAWENSYYQQLQVRDEIATNQHILNNDSFIVIYTGAAVYSSFFQTNGNSWAATGEQTRFYMCDLNDLGKFLDFDEDSEWLKGFMMRDFDYTDKTIDGVLYVNYPYTNRGLILKQKWNEFFHKDVFDQWIKDVKEMDYYPITPEQSDAIIEAYQNGILKVNHLIEYIQPEGE